MGFCGCQGDTGPQGPKGDTGETGPRGSKGDTGETGPRGSIGEIGYTGETGPRGSKGDTGETGPRGPKGDIGDTGSKGDTGNTGPRGEPGVASLSYIFSSDQTISNSKFIGQGNQSNLFDCISYPIGLKGTLTRLVLTIKQNIVNDIPQSPNDDQSVKGYIVKIPYNDNYGTLEVTTNNVIDFIDNNNVNALPPGSEVGLEVVIKDGKHCGISRGNINVNDCDIISLFIRPDNFTSFNVSGIVVNNVINI
jgi:hypothetical protein